jgi:hypothetical protein
MAIARVHDMGAFFSATVTVDGLVVDSVSPDGLGQFGDGVNFSSRVDAIAATLTNSLIANGARAGVSNFGAEVSMANSVVRCHGVDINVESFMGLEGTLVDGGSNLCGCPEATGQCKAVTSSIEAPDPLGDG